MKKYKAIIIDGKRLLRRTLLFCGLVCGIFLLLLAMRAVLPKNFKQTFLTPERAIGSTIPAIEVSTESSARIGEKLRRRGAWLVELLFQCNPKMPSTVLAAEIPLTEAVCETGVARLALHENATAFIETEKPAEELLPQLPLTEKETEIPEAQRAPIKEVDASPKKSGAEVVLGNETSYQVDPMELLSMPPSINMKGDGPKVLVVHTHATEAYAPEGSTIYDTEGSDRSENIEENVVKTGEVLCRIFNQKGIETLHDKTLHDVPSFNGSYAHALASIEKYLFQYPSIEIVFDLHRDSIVYSDKSKAKVVTQINGKTAAQLMFVVGTDQKGLENPNWRENIKNAVHFQNAIEARYPTLMRHINLRRERFNGHTTKGSMIIEVGSSGNSLSEAIYGLSLAADAIGDYLLSLR